MAARTRTPNALPWPAPEYRLTVTLEAPLPFAFAWCTDYRADDATRAGERYERRILQRSRNRILYEDLWSQKDGWVWRRYDVRTRPPDRWHADSWGNQRDASLDYLLTPLSEDRTRLDLVMHRRPASGRSYQPSKRALEAELKVLWSNYARALARDYRAAGARVRARRGARRRAADRRAPA